MYYSYVSTTLCVSVREQNNIEQYLFLQQDEGMMRFRNAIWPCHEHGIIQFWPSGNDVSHINRVTEMGDHSR